MDKEKGSKIIFTCKQSVPMAFYEGSAQCNPASASWQSIAFFEIISSAGVLKTSCQNIDKGFFFVNIVNDFDKVLSYKKNIIICGNLLLILHTITNCYGEKNFTFIILCLLLNPSWVLTNRHECGN